MGILNPKHLYLQERPDKYGGKYSQDELDKFIKNAHKKGQTMIYYGNMRLNVKREMDRINKMKNQKSLFSFFTNTYLKSNKKGKNRTTKKGSTKKSSTKKDSTKKPKSAKKSSTKKGSTKKPKSSKNPKQSRSARKN